MFDHDKIPIVSILIIYSSMLNSGDLLYCLYHVSTSILQNYVLVAGGTNNTYALFLTRDTITNKDVRGFSNKS